MALTRRDDALETDELAAWRGMLRAHAHLAGELDAELLAAHALYDVLVNLEGAGDGRLRMRDLASALVLSRSGLTRMIDRLEREGLVVREPCDDDRRGAFAVLTPTGRARLAEARPTHLAGVRRRFLDLLTDEERAALAALWRRLGYE